MYIYVGRVAAIERSDFDQVLSRKQLAIRCTTRCGVCSTCLTMLVFPTSAGGGPGRVRVVLLGGLLLSISRQHFLRLYSYGYRMQRCIQPPWDGFPRSIARQPRRGQHRTMRFRRALGEMFATPTFFYVHTISSVETSTTENGPRSVIYTIVYGR